MIWSWPLEGPAALESAGQNELVLYRSEAVDGTPIDVSGIVAQPQGLVCASGYTSADVVVKRVPDGRGRRSLLQGCYTSDLDAGLGRITDRSRR